jgi:hypothetical protein
LSLAHTTTRTNKTTTVVFIGFKIKVQISAKRW